MIREWKLEKVQAVEGQVYQVGNRQITVIEIKMKIELPTNSA